MISVASAVRDLARLREITNVLVRHGFGEVVTRAGFGRKAKPKALPGRSEPPPPSIPPPGGADAPEVSSDDFEQGEQVKTRISTAEPSAEQLEVAEAALTACLEAEEPA